ncbi:MAG: hypothetical protein JKY65_02030 [Planctomycetes bacterium]|nr:hypothetical protein [Planctomycetota bacterium]
MLCPTTPPVQFPRYDPSGRLLVASGTTLAIVDTERGGMVLEATGRWGSAAFKPGPRSDIAVGLSNRLLLLSLTDLGVGVGSRELLRRVWKETGYVVAGGRLHSVDAEAEFDFLAAGD